jgi:Holliday junction resolvasome RuvABC endonuclease subunit
VIAGLDPAGRRVAIVWPEIRTTAVLKLKTRRAGGKPVKATEHWGEDAVEVRDWLRGALAAVPADTLWIERPILGGSGNPLAAIRIALTAGLAAGVSTARVEFVFPVVWKAAVVGDGHAGKPACGHWLARWHPALAAACGTDEDLVDAACIALYGQLAAGHDVAGARGLSH